jgi:hypothetical protein
VPPSIPGNLNLSELTSQIQNLLNRLIKPGQPSSPAQPQPTNSNGPNVVVVDQTSIPKAGIDIDGDRTPDTAHGTIVGQFIKTTLPDANVSTVELPDFEPASLVAAFNGVAQRIDRGEKVDAVNFSAQTFDTIPDLAKATGLPLTQDNLAQFKGEIRNRLKILSQNPTAFGGTKDQVERMTQFVPVLESLDRLTERNIPVYVAAGNDGKNQINLFTLVNNAKVIGATNAQGQKTDYTADNSLITRFTRGDFPVVPIRNAAGQVTGADFTGDNKQDIDANSLSGKGRTFAADQQVSGTSFATPKALAEDLRNRFQGGSISALA